MSIRKRTPTSSASIKTESNPEHCQNKMSQTQSVKHCKNNNISDYSSEYYNNCSKYTFSKDLKATRPNKLTKA